jgi:hypothetical protein
MSSSVLSPWSYLPAPVQAVITIEHLNRIRNAYFEDDPRLYKYNASAKVLLETVLAVAGCVIFYNYAEKFGARFLPLMFVAGCVFPGAAILGTSGYFTVTGTLGFADAVRRRDVLDIAKNLVLTAFAYLGTTLKIQDWTDYYIFSQIYTVGHKINNNL